ncbi:hypothetical protein WOLCODRAFT_115527 [Wolfiporia cocos MD-104 SS10]|uniref:Uncharacterized protein n=1 Tax=Wolfiporia cocos (strain MD-104) TaxID=742152 RepID=A0A2H3J8B3_WOLCO|nr:hypothetical protein WOLCODRAFT_115527 [Wolfiporia cocos MD-104 SS10]
MHRLRSKKSDIKRGQVPEPLHASPPEPVPVLPAPDDFRTSLILPDLTRRFSLLRSSSGSPLPLEDLKSKFAEQRARGSQHQVTEEEEDMILEALERLHAKNGRQRAASTSGEEADGELTSAPSETADSSSASPSMTRQSIRSMGTMNSNVPESVTSSAAPSPAKSSHQARRMSNNLFGSGKFRDQAYLRSANQARRGGSGRTPLPIARSDSTMSMSTMASSRAGQNNSVYSDNQSLRPSTPEGSSYTPSNSVPSSPNKDQMFERQSAQRSVAAHSRSGSTAEAKAVSTRLSRQLTSEGLRRASLALEQAIKEMEEEGDDEIVMERFPISHAPSNSQSGAATSTVRHPPCSAWFPRGVANESRPTQQADPTSPVSPVDVEAGTALSSDDQVAHEDAQRASPYPRSSTTSPMPRLPGYIPGMPRPMTPHEPTLDSDDQTPSTTPRATSPRLPGSISSVSYLAQNSSVYRSNSAASTASRHIPAAASSPSLSSTPPLFFERRMNGRYTPEDRQRSGNNSPISEQTDAPSSPARRRPNSPLAGPAYQPLAGVGSRPSTPSNVTWNTSSSPAVSKAAGRRGSESVHGRNESTASISSVGTDGLERSKSLSKSLRSPALPDSPLVDHGIGASGAPFALEHDSRPASAMSGIELGSPLQLSTRSLRSPTPTRGRHRSQTYSGYSSSTVNGSGKRSSKSVHHAAFSLGSAQGLMLSPIANSSHSSLGSTGSSYHSWDENHKQDRLRDLFSSLDSHNGEWHDLSGADKSSSSTPGTSPDGVDVEQVEQVVRNETGLTKADFVMIQERLVAAASTKAATPDSRVRASSLRKRRPSTSQSNYSFTGVESKPTSSTPQPQSAVKTSTSKEADHLAKANALLNAVVDSIESPRAKAQPALEPEEPPVTTITAPPEPPLSSPGTRQRALADALFGAEDRERLHMDFTLSPLVGIAVVSPEQTAEASHPEPSPAPSSQPLASSSLTADVKPLVPPFDSGVPSTSYVDAASLERDVQQRAEAATAALRKSPSIPKVGDGHGSVPRKRIHPNQISTPKLVSASTSVEAIPLRAPLLNPAQPAPPSNKIFKRLRGTLRPKAALNGEEVVPHPLELRTPPSAAGSSASIPKYTDPVVVSATDPGLPKVPAASTPSPPASATPGLKSFMARFRKQRATDTYPAPQRQRPGPASMSVSLSAPLPSRRSVDQPLSAPVTQTNFAPLQSVQSPPPQLPLPSISPEPIMVDTDLPLSNGHASSEEAALRQLFDAANDLGLDQAALNDLIARSPSTSSKSTTWTKLTRMGSTTGSRKSRVQGARTSAQNNARSPPVSEGRPSMDDFSPRPSVEVQQPPIPKAPEPTPRPRRERENGQDLNPVVRRTIIYPSDTRAPTVDLSALTRKQSASRKRRSAGVASIQSVRSIYDRVPTPPPHKSGSGGRFSTEDSPPVPQLPPAITGQTDTLLPPGQANSTYDSFYDMYSGDGRAGSSSHLDVAGGSHSPHPQPDTIHESGPAIELIERANGETIWSIVNGLRDDDGESFYGDRASFVSDYSRRDSANEGLKLFFKGHEKKSSKGSNASFSLRKRPQPQSAAMRPETKVYFSTSAHIGRLIDNLSRGVDAGSFNIAPERAPPLPGHSASSVGSEADTHSLTVEEKLEQMIGSISSP